MRISDWSSDVCSSDLCLPARTVCRRQTAGRGRAVRRDRAKPAIGLAVAGAKQSVAWRQAADRYVEAGSGRRCRGSGADGVRPSVTFDAAILRELAVGIDVTGYLRIMDARFRHKPTGTSLGMSRFSSPAARFTLLYIAQDLQTALAERVIRDRFQGRQDRKSTRLNSSH